MNNDYRNDQRRGDGPGRDHGGPPRRGGRGPPHPGRGGDGGSFIYEQMVARQRESRAAILKRQLVDIDLSDTLASPSTLAARHAALAAAPGAVAGPSSFGPPPEAPFMHDAFYSSTSNDLIGADDSAAAAFPGAGGVPEAGDLAVAVETALNACEPDVSRNRRIRSKGGGKFTCRPEQSELVWSSGGSGKRS